MTGRLAFSDMTNLPSKRGISSILGDFLLKSGEDSSGNNNSNALTREGGGSGVKFSKRLRSVVDDLVKENTRTNDSNSGSGSDDGDESENFDLVDVKESQGETNNAGEVIGFVEPLKCEKDSDMTVFSSQTDEITTTREEDLAMTTVCNGESDDKLAIAEIKNSDDSSQKSMMNTFSINRCSNLDVHHNNMEVHEDDELKSCSCSFCLKAAYIWSDLHYQDIKGRLSVLKKSQKETSNLIQRNCKGGKPTDNNANVEFDLMGQWATLFLSMQGILASESNHLQNSFETMKELRENCKIDLEKSTKTPQHNNKNNNNDS